VVRHSNLITPTSTGELQRWVVGGEGGWEPRTGVLVFEYEQWLAGRSRHAFVLALHELMMSVTVPDAPEVIINVPNYRGSSFVSLLSWIVTTRLASAHATIFWRPEHPRLLGYIKSRLEKLGWKLESRRRGKVVELVGQLPEPHPPPKARRLVTQIEGRDVEFIADFGVFSADRIDAGTLALFEVALRGPSVKTLADIGTGYGYLAIGLILSGKAHRAISTEVDSVALWLAGLNARAAGVSLALAFEPRPDMVEPTELTVCNIPTHLEANKSRQLTLGLIRRANIARVLAVVHASLEGRYAKHFETQTLSVQRYHIYSHVVFDVFPA